MEDSTPVVVNVMVSFTLIMAVVGLALGKAVLVIRMFLRLDVMNPELPAVVVVVVVVVVIADVSGVNIVVTAVSFNELLEEIAVVLVDVASFHLEVSG